jgi:hypothetical protein
MDKDEESWNAYHVKEPGKEPNGMNLSAS